MTHVRTCVHAGARDFFANDFKKAIDSKNWKKARFTLA